MKKKSETTSKTQIVRQLRILWLRSRERATALQRDNYCCVDCGVKQSKAKGKEQQVHVHHKKGVCNWDKIIEVLREELLCDPKDLETLCPYCHDKK
jgi:5-methylcytosine-specific restriction endonuclease McrA